MMQEENIRISKAAKMLGVTAQTLRNWEKSGKLRAYRSPGGQRYYNVRDLEHFLFDLKKMGWAWAASAQPPNLPKEYYCERQDRFTSRLENMALILSQSVTGLSQELISLTTLIAGEIGENSFTHNIGNWPDVPGVFFGYDATKRLIVLADRGRGIRATLQRVRPNISHDADALRVAFTEIISGRDPERRGNGLKVVRGIAESHAVGLLFQSGLGVIQIPKDPGSMHVAMADENVRGVYAMITF